MVSVEAPWARLPRDHIAIGGAQNAPEIDAPVRFEILVFNRDDGATQNIGVVLVGGDDAALQGE